MALGGNLPEPAAIGRATPLIADAEATDLPSAYCFSTLARFLVRVLQLSPGGGGPGSAPQQPSDPEVNAR